MLKLTRFDRNPILAPREGQAWEADGVFNPGAVKAGGSIHLLYRAVDANRLSRIGYARTENGTDFTFRPTSPVLEPSAEWEEFGCEDPRITPIDGYFLVTYTAFSRRGTRLALASTKDFMSFEKHGVVGPDRDDKDFVLFPEKVNGKVAMLHRLDSKIQIAYFDNLDALNNSQEFWTKYVTHVNAFEVISPKYHWEEWKVGIGPPPIKTDRGWLVFYHGVNVQRIYRVGAALLDLDNPANILARTSEPILEPEMDFERRGIVPNVVFPTGVVILDGDLLVYYGGADRITCVTKTPIDDFLDELEKAS
ncbi:MAG TPA: hypothetical protein VLV18_03145 [Terriglobales bacterium]|nr:hypothetical protein [Terriglobales bacterium]